MTTAEPPLLTQEDYRQLAIFLEDQLPHCKSQGEADELRQRLARLYFEMLGDPVRAAVHAEELLRPMEPLIAKDPDDDDLRRRYVETATAAGAEVRAADTLARAIKKTLANDVRERVGFEAATLYLEQGEIKQARSALLDVVLVDAGGPCALPAARRLLDLEGEPGDPKVVGPALEMIAKGASDPADRQAAALRLLSMQKSKRPKESRLAIVYAALVDSPRAEEALAWLRTYYERKGDTGALADVFRRQALRAKDPDVARPLALRSLELFHFDNDDQRTQEWLRFIERYGPHHKAYTELIPLFERSARWRDLCGAIEADIDLAPPDERPALLTRLGQTLALRGDGQAALASFQRCLALDATNDVARGGLEILMAGGDRRLAAADVLEPIFRSANHQEGLVRVLETRGELLAESSARLGAMASAADIAMDALDDADRCMKICGRALVVSLASATDRVLDWIVRMERVAGRARRADLLAAILIDVLGDDPIDSFERVAVAVSAMEAFVAAGASDRALALCGRALASDPSSPELLHRLDELAKASESPEERLARYSAALDVAKLAGRRLSLMHAIAAMKRDSLGDLPGAVQMWRAILDENPSEHAVYEALIDAMTKLGDADAALDLIERARSTLQGAEHIAMTLRQAAALGQRGDGDRALALCREILIDESLSPSALESIAQIARDEGDHVIYRSILDRIIAGGDTEAKREALERLGDSVFEDLGDRRAAVESWKAAALMCGDAPAEQEHARSLYERVVETWSDDREATLALAELNVRSGDWQKIPDALRTLIRAEKDLGRCAQILLHAEPSAMSARAADEFVSLADELLSRLGSSPSEEIRALARARARALVSDPDRQVEASQAYRQLIESHENKEDVADFEVFVESRPGADERHGDRRWLYQWRAAHDAHPVPILIEWAKAEEEYGEPAAAIPVYERLTGDGQARSAALEALCRLKFHAGDFAGGLAAFGAMREGRSKEEQVALDVKTARTLLEDMGRPIEAAGVVAPALAVRPAIFEARAIAHQMLADADCSANVAARFEELAASFEDPAALCIFEVLLASNASPGIASASRQRWIRRMLDLSDADPTTALSFALPAAIELVDDVSLWQGVERIAEASGQSGDVANAYRRLVLERITDPALADMVGARMVALEEKCAIRSPQSVEVLLRVLSLSPGSRWALDRVKQVLGSNGRYGELLDLFDRAIDAAPDEKQRGDLFYEAACTARDLAGELPRAIAYLESLHALRADDTNVDLALERLYEREGREADLIDLFHSRAHRETGFKRRDLLRGVAGLCLDLGDVERAGAAVQQLLSDDVHGVADLTDILERIVDLAGTAPQSVARRGVSPAATVQQRAMELLGRHYESVDAIDDLIRLGEKALVLATEPDKIGNCVRDLVRLRLRAEGGTPGAFVRAAARVESDVGCDLRLTKIAYMSMLLRAIHCLKGAGGPARVDAEEGVSAAIERLVSMAVDARRPEAAVRLLYRASRLPLGRSRRRELLRVAASMSWETLQDRTRAIGILRELFDEDAADDVAARSVEFFSKLLDGAGQYREVAKLWEGQAKLHTKAPNIAEEQACWERAAELWERHGAWKETLRAHRKAAALGSEQSLEALARLHATRREWVEVAKALESLRSKFPAPESEVRALRLAEAYVELDDRDRARACLEAAAPTAGTEIRTRLASLYRQDELWKPLVARLVEDARRAEDPQRKLPLLREAAELLQSKLGQREAAAALFEQAVALDPRDGSLRASWVGLLEAFGRWDEAASVLHAQVELFGEQRSRERALVHHRLACALLRMGRRDDALVELRAALDMQPSDTAILHDVARVALDAEDLDLSERAYRSLLLSPRPAQDAGTAFPPRARIFADLSEIAVRKGDDARAADLVDSAFDEAIEHGEAPHDFEQGLRLRARHDLHARALERRVERGSTLTLRATALADLAGLWKEKLGSHPELVLRLKRHGERIARDLEHESLTDPSAWGALAIAHAGFGDDGGTSLSGPLVERAITELSSAVAQDPTARDAVDLLSGLLERQERFDESVTLLANRLRLLSAAENAFDIADASWRLGRALERAGRPNDALSVYESVLDHEPTDVAMIRELLARLEDLRSKRVADCLERWIVLDAAAGAAAAKRLVVLRYEEDNQGGAIRALDAAIAANPTDADLLSQRATERERAGDRLGAASDFERASVIDAARIDALVDLLARAAGSADLLLTDARLLHVADTLVRLERPLQGRRELGRLLASPTDWARFADLLAARSVAEDAEGKKSDSRLRAAGVFLEGANDPAATLRLLAPLRKAQPDDIEALLLSARAQVAMGQAEQAVASLSLAAERHRGKRSPLLASICLEIAKAHLAVDEVVEAFAALESAFSANWRAGDVAMLLGLVALDLGDDKAAERALSAVTSLPTSGPSGDGITKAVAFCHLASMAFAKGDLAKARRLANRALDGDPSHASARALLDTLTLPRRAGSAQ